MTDKMGAAHLRSGMAQFTGTEQWHRYSPLFPQFLLTDGAKFVCENAGAYWLADAIGSHIFTNRKVFSPRVEPFQVWTLEVGIGNKAKLTCTDGGKEGGNPKQLVQQKIEYTDFPLDEITMWAIWDEGMEAFVLLLPSEVLSMWSEAILEATREYDRASARLYALTRRVREIIIFVGKDGVAHPAVDWAGTLRRKRLVEKKPTHTAPARMQ